MRAVVFHGVGDIRLDDVPEPEIREATDAIVRITTSAICGTDLHLVRGTVAGMKPGTILGHEGVGIVEETGRNVRNFKPGDRVVIPATIACGICVYCRAGYQAQCDQANPRGPGAGTAFFGGPAESGGFPGLQAEKARVPFANSGLVRLPADITDSQAIMLSDVFPTGYFGADIAEIEPGDTVAVFGCGPVGLFTILSAKLMGAGRILAIDRIASRLRMAQNQGAEVIDFDADDPVEVIRELTEGVGVDRVIDAVGVDADPPHKGPAKRNVKKLEPEFAAELRDVPAGADRQDGEFQPGMAPSLVLHWAVESVAKAGTVAIIGVYPQTAHTFPIGQAIGKNLTMQMGNCNHRKYIPELIEMVRSGMVDPEEILTQSQPLDQVIEAYEAFDRRQEGWIKVGLSPQESTVGFE